MTGEESGVIGFECSERCIEHFPTRHDDDVEAANVFSPPEELTGSTLRPVAFDGRTKFPGRRHAKPRRRGPVGHDEHRHEPAVDLGAGTVNPLELRAAANPLRRRQTLIFHAGTREASVYRSSATVRRLRPFARRRLSTIRPFFVAIRILKPCVFLRRRVLGW